MSRIQGDPSGQEFGPSRAAGSGAQLPGTGPRACHARDCSRRERIWLHVGAAPAHALPTPRPNVGASLPDAATGWACAWRGLALSLRGPTAARAARTPPTCTTTCMPWVRESGSASSALAAHPPACTAAALLWLPHCHPCCGARPPPGASAPPPHSPARHPRSQLICDRCKPAVPSPAAASRHHQLHRRHARGADGGRPQPGRLCVPRHHRHHRALEDGPGGCGTAAVEPSSYAAAGVPETPVFMTAWYSQRCMRRQPGVPPAPASRRRYAPTAPPARLPSAQVRPGDAVRFRRMTVEEVRRTPPLRCLQKGRGPVSGTCQLHAERRGLLACRAALPGCSPAPSTLNHRRPMPSASAWTAGYRC